MMQKEFNDTGLCIPNRHYMVDNADKLEQIMALVEKDKYFTISRPRQFGKTTIMFLLDKTLNLRDDYVAVKLSFEGIDSEAHQERFVAEFLNLLTRRLAYMGLSDISGMVDRHRPETTSMSMLSHLITTLVRTRPGQSWVLMIDEVDKSSNNQLFLDFLGMLRNKYLHREDGEETFQAIILAGVHDIKTLRQKIQPGQASGCNSPWNIAIDFEVDLSFAAHEIETMVHDYSQDKGIEPDIPAIARQLYHYTSGYPYLVSKLCKFIDEKIIPRRDGKNWTADDVEAAFKMIVNKGYTTTLFDSLTKNLENNEQLYNLVFQIVINGNSFDFTIANPVINLAHLYGIIVQSNQEHCQIHNRIFEQRIYDYMLSKFIQKDYEQVNGFGGPEFFTAGGLDVKLILRRFQTFMKEHYSHKDRKFLEREGRLLFLSYLRPIINGRGFDFKEPVVADERRMDIVITYRDRRYVIELKRWYGDKYHQRGLQQLSDYLDIYGLKDGCLLIYDFNKSKSYKEEQIQFQDKEIFTVWV